MKPIGKLTPVQAPVKAPVGKLSPVEQPKPAPEEKPKTTHPILTFLRGDLVDPETKKSFGLEGFSVKTYNPGGKSGITIGTGVDLKFHTRKSMIEKGVPEEVAKKLDPYYGKSEKSLVGKAPLTREEVELVDEAVIASTINKLKKRIPHFDEMPFELQKAAIMAQHQYGDKWPKLRGHLQAKEYKEAVRELVSWEDSSKDKDGKPLGKNIEKKYHAIGKLADVAVHKPWLP